MKADGIVLRPAARADLNELEALENATFDSDRLSRRSFRYWLGEGRGDLTVAVGGDRLLGYVLVIYHRGTRLARLYSLAVSESARGMGVGRRLVTEAENCARRAGRLFLRLEVRKDNKEAIGLYEAMGYRRFGELRDYYEDHQDALRYQKRIRFLEDSEHRLSVPWIQQTTRFTCGPACLMMAMAALRPEAEFPPTEELRIWREATTIFMTSGHGGSHPLGLALAAAKRGFSAEVWVNTREPLFVDSVRGQAKKDIVAAVDQDFRRQARERGTPVHVSDITQEELVTAVDRGRIPLVLISTWRMDSRKAPHWVVVTGYDEQCFYVHDPDPDEDTQTPLDCQYLPIDRNDFASMSAFGQARLRTAVIVARSATGETGARSNSKEQ